MKRYFTIITIITAFAFSVQADEIWVDISDFAYGPPHLYMEVGTTVTWTNYDDTGHTVTDDADLFDSGLLAQNESWSYTFNTVGDYFYYCVPHPWMLGEVHVRTVSNLNLLLDINPEGGPIVIPASGAGFNYTATGTNQVSVPVPFNYWVKAYLPNNAPYSAAGPFSFTLPAGASGTGNLAQNVPQFAPPGTYRYVGYLGSYPDVVQAWDSFEFTKATSLDGELGDWEAVITSPWSTSSDNSENSAGISSTPIIEKVKLWNSPEPFNPSTVINYALPADGLVQLDVFNITGAKVATLVEGYAQAGQHQVTFDASQLTSGMYVYRLDFEGQSFTGKMLLVK